MLTDVTVPTRVVLVGTPLPELSGPYVPGNGTFRFTRGAPDEPPAAGGSPGDEPGAADTPIVVDDRPDT